MPPHLADQARPENGRGCCDGQTASLKERHEHLGKGSQTLIKGSGGGFTAERIADEHGHKINQLIVIKASASKSHLCLDELHETICFQDSQPSWRLLRTNKAWSEPIWGNLDVD